MENGSTYSKQELMITRAARELSNGDIVFVGIGLPNMVANLARQLHAPEAKLIYESGVYGAVPETWPESIGDPCLVVNSLAVHCMSDLFLFYLQGDRIDVGFLGAAQIDRYGNINTTVVQDYWQPKVRLPGSGGACEIALLAKKVVVTMPQSAGHFPQEIDFVTSPGHKAPGQGWVRASIYGKGPVTVVTNMAVFGFERDSGEMEVLSLHPGVPLSDLQQNMGWEPRLSPQLSTTPPPSESELGIIRKQMKLEEKRKVG